MQLEIAKGSTGLIYTIKVSVISDHSRNQTVVYGKF